MLSTIFSATVVFAATNIDDILVLMLFYSMLDAESRAVDIAIGQYIGIAALVAISMVGFLGSFFVPKALIGALGLAPIILGVIKIKQRPSTEPDARAGSGVEDAMKPKPGKSARATRPLIINVALVSIANGGDNIGIYVPYFASVDLHGLLISISVFLALVAAWCFISYKLVQQKHIAYVFTRYGDLMVPFVLIALGISILIKNGTLEWITGLAG
ncbi:MAG: hypothetical protein A2Y38_23255 [Spirochaetes bacterium GWB1_59_5]|nr:MAG: hypothetical protein A2Y38_23255 [Spirochaetes bacterium GWB1_59_5]